MIYYVTVHWGSARWVDIQLENIRKYTSHEYKVCAWLTGIENKHSALFDFIIEDEDPSHDIKLDILARHVLEVSQSDEDWIIFLDGDAFPIAPVYEKVNKYLEQYPLIAIQRLENVGDLQPHPCFCAVKVGFWKQFKPSWKSGYGWYNDLGMITTDVGAGLLQILEEQNIQWKSLHRTNAINLHPVLFGIYDDLIYHHGAGFREGGVVRYDYYINFKRDAGKRLDARILMKLSPKKYKTRMANSILHPGGRVELKLRRRNIQLSKRCYNWIVNDCEGFMAYLKNKNNISLTK